MNRLLALLTLLASLLCGTAALAETGMSAASTVITLKAVSEVKTAAIRLSDVFDGVPSSFDRDIAIAPVPGKSVTYDVNVLTRLASQYHLEWQAQSLGDRSILTRASTRVTQDMIRDAVIEKIKGDDDAPIKGSSVEVMFDNRNLEVNLPAGRAPSFALNNFDYDQNAKRFRADLVADTGAAPIVLPVSGRVLTKRDVPVLAHRLEQGTVIGDADLSWQTVAVDRLAADAVTESSQLVGRELRHDVAEGQLMHARDLAQPRLVTRGSLVTMKIETPYLQVTAQGRALQDGIMGDVVRITNTQSNRVVEGTIIGAGTVKVHAVLNGASLHASAE